MLPRGRSLRDIPALGVGDLSDSGFHVYTSPFPYILCWPRWESVDHRTQERSRSPGICWPLFTSTLPKSVSLIAGPQKQPRVQFPFTAFTGGRETDRQKSSPHSSALLLRD